MQRFWNGIADAVGCDDGDLFAGISMIAPALDIFCGVLSGNAGFLGYIVHEIMNVKHITAGENARNICLKAFVDRRTGGDRI